MIESMPLLATKLYLPPPRTNVVLRPHLIERLNAGLHRKLTLVAAPAGFGKTTLLSEWLARCGRPVAWLSLDEGDSDPTRFLAYLVAALQTIAPRIGTGVVALLQSPQPPPMATILAALLNEMTTLPMPCVLVLDDCHLVDAAPGGRPPLGAVDQGLTFLVEHLSPQLHLVIATREDPALPLARLRARGQLTELRAADLRFTPTEAAAFLNQVMALDLSAAEVAALEQRTEGWIAGLQLAALSLQGRADMAQFVSAFAGDNRYIVDYLVEEVLQRQPALVRSFLLQTAILDRLHGSLCDAVTGQTGGSAGLEALERGNFFVVPLDDTRHWYRYHQLFGEVLATHLRAEQPALVPRLHQRASAWYAANGFPFDAIRHALTATDFARAADLIELAWTAMRRRRQDITLLGWLQALPAALFDGRPVLGVAYAHLLLGRGEFADVEDRLRAAERWLEPGADGQAQPHPAQGRVPPGNGVMSVVDEESFRRLPGTIAVARAGLAMARGDVPGTMTYARRALDLAPEDDYMTRGGAAGFLGLAAWTHGDLDAAYRMFAEGMTSLQKAGHIADAINGASTLAIIRLAQGRLHAALRTYEQALQLATAQGEPVLRGTADLYVGLSTLHRERNDLLTATQHLLKSQELGEHTRFPQNRYRWPVAMARIREAQGDLDGALALLDEAERLYMSDFAPNVRPIAALKTRLWVAQGRLGEALDWVREQRLSAQDDLSYLREFEHITLARVLLARAQRDRADHARLEAMDFLARLLSAAEAGERMGSVLEILVLQALAYQTQGDVPAALVPLKRALTLAEPEGYVRLFVDEGPPMRALIAACSMQGPAGSPASSTQPRMYAAKLLASFDQGNTETKAAASPPAFRAQRAPAHAAPGTLVEPLSERELDVLRLLGTELNGPEMAHKLMVSLNTLRTHTKNIYSKLEVNNRQAAIRRAAELDLL